MGDVVHITERPVRHTSAAAQALRKASEVAAYDELDLLFTVYEAPAGTDITVRILTAMQMESDEGWVTAGTFAATGESEASLLHLEGFLRYVRYELTTNEATTTFLVQGVARSWA